MLSSFWTKSNEVLPLVFPKRHHLNEDTWEDPAQTLPFGMLETRAALSKLIHFIKHTSEGEGEWEDGHTHIYTLLLALSPIYHM